MKPPLTRQETFTSVSMSETESVAGASATERVVVRLPTGVQLTFPSNFARLMIDRVFERMSSSTAMGSVLEMEAATASRGERARGEEQVAAAARQEPARAGALREEEASFTESLDVESRNEALPPNASREPAVHGGRETHGAEARGVETRGEMREEAKDAFLAEPRSSGRPHAASHPGAEQEHRSHAAPGPLAGRHEEVHEELLTGTVDAAEAGARPAHPAHGHRPSEPRAAVSELREEVARESLTETVVDERASVRPPPPFPNSVAGREHTSHEPRERFEGG